VELAHRLRAYRRIGVFFSPAPLLNFSPALFAFGEREWMGIESYSPPLVWSKMRFLEQTLADTLAEIGPQIGYAS